MHRTHVNSGHPSMTSYFLLPSTLLPYSSSVPSDPRPPQVEASLSGSCPVWKASRGCTVAHKSVSVVAVAASAMLCTGGDTGLLSVPVMLQDLFWSREPQH